MSAPKAAEWACRVAAWPVAFAQVREDPRLDLELLLQQGHGARVVMIASGGETAVCLGRQPLAELILVDMNAAQLALTRLKWHLAAHFPPEQRRALLGHGPMSAAERGRVLAEILRSLHLAADALGPMEIVAARGPDQMGRYERLFEELRRELAPHRLELDELLRVDHPPVAVAMAARGTKLGRALDAALDRVMALPNLVRLFGEAATQNPRQPFARHFAARVRQALRNHPAATNPFLWQMLAGTFPPGQNYDWLMDDQPPRVQPIFRHAEMRATLDQLSAQSMTLVHLSNILDWLPVEEATATLQSAARVLPPGGKVIVRQLNSSLDIAALPGGFAWDTALGAEFAARDRSFFYSHIHIGERR